MEVSQTSKSRYSPGLVEKAHLPISHRADPQSNGLFRKYIHLLAYCLMPNHFHLLIMVVNPNGKLKLPGGSLRNFQPISEFTKRLLITFAHKFNWRHQREGAVFQGRSKVKPVTTDSHVVQAARYIHNNPVTASLVKSPEDWTYSDFHVYHTPGSLRNFQVTKPEFILNYFGGSGKDYVEFVNAGYEEEIKELKEMLIDAEEE